MYRYNKVLYRLPFTPKPTTGPMPSDRVTIFRHDRRELACPGFSLRTSENVTRSGSLMHAAWISSSGLPDRALDDAEGVNQVQLVRRPISRGLRAASRIHSARRRALKALSDRAFTPSLRPSISTSKKV